MGTQDNGCAATDGAGGPGLSREQLALDALNEAAGKLELTEDERNAIALELAQPVVVPKHVLLVFSQIVHICADQVAENEALYNALSEVGLAAMEPASQAEMDDLGEECPDEFGALTADVFTALAWSATVIANRQVTSVRDVEDDDDDDYDVEDDNGAGD